MFNNFVVTYQNALDNSNFKYTLKYIENKKTQTEKKTERPRKVIYFNLLFLPIRKTYIGKAFFKTTNEDCKQNKILSKNS